MFKKDNFIPPLSSFELRRQASIERNLAIQACMRAAVRASAKWLRMLLQRSTRLARDLTAERRRRSAIRELHRLDDRTPARRLWAAAIVCFAIGSTMAAESVPPVCVAADLRLTTLIEAHGEAQDVAADTLAQAFFTVMEARKACHEGHVEAAMKLYEGIPLGPLPPETITD
jgi:hypothetical protein